MAKIKGWTKTRNSSVASSWRINHPTKSIYDAKEVDVIEDRDLKKWVVFVSNGRGDYPKNASPDLLSFKSRKKAEAIAINYMRSHPNG